ncbi:MAG: hypothetical protein INF92_19150 [Rhodobacter sp.]|nr:hypothetical protein [Rhodobacter sp.]
MPRIVLPALVYVAAVFAVAFALGTLRVLLVVPYLGELAAVALEVPVVLCLSWLVAGRVLRRWPLTGRGQRLAMGGLAFVCLMALELIVATGLFGRPLDGVLAAMATLPGLAGLAGQIGFALVPALRGQVRG